MKNRIYRKISSTRHIIVTKVEENLKSDRKQKNHKLSTMQSTKALYSASKP